MESKNGLDSKQLEKNLFQYNSFKDYITSNINSLEEKMLSKLTSSFKAPLSEVYYVDYSDPKNRRIRAKKEISRGDLITVSMPLSSTINSKNYAIYCHFCYKKSASLKQCSNCQFALYCNGDCQRCHWKEHKLLCKLLKSYQNPLFSTPSLVNLTPLIYGKTKVNLIYFRVGKMKIGGA